ncbi:MAG: hypothetical protein EA359_14820 [Balneolaceae bacterium]|nr:MAG: hypothetical protein EA359_14820 [Balneolaceae bacterium]
MGAGTGYGKNNLTAPTGPRSVGAGLSVLLDLGTGYRLRAAGFWIACSPARATSIPVGLSRKGKAIEKESTSNWFYL